MRSTFAVRLKPQQVVLPMVLSFFIRKSLKPYQGHSNPTSGSHGRQEQSENTTKKFVFNSSQTRLKFRRNLGMADLNVTQTTYGNERARWSNDKYVQILQSGKT